MKYQGCSAKDKIPKNFSVGKARTKAAEVISRASGQNYFLIETDFASKFFCDSDSASKLFQFFVSDSDFAFQKFLASTFEAKQREKLFPEIFSQSLLHCDSGRKISPQFCE